jgi:hypothetical protein
MNADAASLSTPVVILIYKRPEATRRLMEILALHRPVRLYVVADAPRSQSDAARCEEAFEAATKPSWSCELKVNRAERNMGCRKRVSSGLDWVFSFEEEAIILEDDLQPGPDFFRFAPELLDYYRSDPQVMHISGNNHQRGIRRSGASYTFSKHTHCWGWATWRRAWQLNESDMASWPSFRDSGALRRICPNSLEREYFTRWLNWVHAGEKDSWAYVWTYSMWKAGGLGINPEANLVSNTGFGPDATHTQDASAYNVAAIGTLVWPLVHPCDKVSCEVADAYTFDKHFEGDSIRSARSITGRIRQFRNGLIRRWRRFTQRS